MLFNIKYRVAKNLSREYPYLYSDIMSLKNECDLTDEQLKELVKLANEGSFLLTTVSSVLTGFKRYL